MYLHFLTQFCLRYFTVKLFGKRLRVLAGVLWNSQITSLLPFWALKITAHFQIISLNGHITSKRKMALSPSYSWGGQCLGKVKWLVEGHTSEKWQNEHFSSSSALQLSPDQLAWSICASPFFHVSLSLKTIYYCACLPLWLCGLGIPTLMMGVSDCKVTLLSHGSSPDIRYFYEFLFGYKYVDTEASNWTFCYNTSHSVGLVASVDSVNCPVT